MTNENSKYLALPIPLKVRNETLKQEIIRTTIALLNEGYQTEVEQFFEQEGLTGVASITWDFSWDEDIEGTNYWYQWYPDYFVLLSEEGKEIPTDEAQFKRLKVFLSDCLISFQPDIVHYQIKEWVLDV